ncbi:hypothetical protein Nepgr_016510 [Nepenthes gracilis]|uniref:Uncharacterized protein n=1 Tax=Nepenthes gracilis TaxID=150966 RepID=A0AAD3XS65_NEPGR|nr:hypothetical protein Nepgr_016510 [Nepenthes gracilis]
MKKHTSPFLFTVIRCSFSKSYCHSDNYCSQTAIPRFFRLDLKIFDLKTIPFLSRIATVTVFGKWCERKFKSGGFITLLRGRLRSPRGGEGYLRRLRSLVFCAMLMLLS